MLKQCEREGSIRLKFLDESGFCCQGIVGYGWLKIGEQKRIEQKKKRRGRRISILGTYEVQKSFKYALVVGGVKSKSYIEFLDWEAKEAEKELLEKGIITVIAQDNCSIHKSKKVKEKIPSWQEKGLEFFFLPKYSCEMNLIEPEWNQIKKHELSSRNFSDEYDLAMAVQEGIERRGKKNNITVTRYRYNST